MPTAVVSDLHLAAASRADVTRLEEPRERLLEALGDAGTIVLLGDALELREAPLARALEISRPFFERLGEVAAGRRVVLVPGNHDHQLAEPWLVRRRLDAAALGLDSRWPVTAGEGPAGRISEWMPEVELELAYPGLRLRDDVYATHGHYLDLHLTVPRLESIAASAMGRLTGLGRGCRSPADYETVLAPLYAFLYGLGQGASTEPARRGGSLSRRVWRSVDGDGGLRGFLLGRVTIPGAVAALNRGGLGPFSPVLTGAELRRAGLRAMGDVVEGLGIDEPHVIFGHTHRAGPLPGDDPAEWRTPRGTRLWNSGSWLSEPAFTGPNRDSPYWPGTVLLVPDEGEPELRNVLRDAEIALPTR